METLDIITAINNLSAADKLLVIEKTIHSLRENQLNELSMAAESLEDEYRTNKELTVFTSLDIENFYEPR